MKLTYFDLRGRAEPIRLAFILGGIEFEDDRFAFSSWKDIKATTPYGAVPTMTVDGEVAAQSNAILRYVGKLGKLYPTCSLAALKVDEIVDTLADLAMVLYGYRGDDQEKLKEQRNKFVTEGIPRYAGALEKRLSLFGEGVYAVDDKLSIADIVITCFINSIKCGIMDFVPTDVFDEYPKLMAIHKTIMEQPSVVEWYEKYPIKYQTPKME
ncbi:Glutathione S-transferase [Gracilaria domingensis]|nr:Glutathione S-transferase [Gracilaria domingensis]